MTRKLVKQILAAATHLAIQLQIQILLVSNLMRRLAQQPVQSATIPSASRLHATQLHPSVARRNHQDLSKPTSSRACRRSRP